MKHVSIKLKFIDATNCEAVTSGAEHSTTHWSAGVQQQQVSHGCSTHRSVLPRLDTPILFTLRAASGLGAILKDCTTRILTCKHGKERTKNSSQNLNSGPISKM